MAGDVIGLRGTLDDVYHVASGSEEGGDGTTAVVLARRFGWEVDVAMAFTLDKRMHVNNRRCRTRRGC